MPVYNSTSERIAEKILSENNWQPTKIFPQHGFAGYPDFSCSDDRYVEIKRIVTNAPCIQITYNQLVRWEKLINKGKKVFLMIFSKKNEYELMFEIKKGDINDK